MNSRRSSGTGHAITTAKFTTEERAERFLAELKRSGPLQGPSVFLVLGILLIARSRTALFRHMLKTVSPAVSVEVKDRNVRNAFLRWAASGDLRVGIYARLLRKVVKMTVTEGRAVQTCLTEANSDVGRREGHGGGNVDDDPTRATSDLIMLSRALVDQVTARLEVLEPTSRVHPPMTPREEAAAIMRERGRAEGPTRARAAETAARSIAASAPCDCLECAQPAPSVSNGQDYVSNTANTPDEPRQSTRRLTRQSARQPTRHAPPAPGVDEAGQSDLSNGLPAPDHQEESSLPVTIAVPVVMAMSTLTVVQPDEVSERLVVRLLEHYLGFERTHQVLESSAARRRPAASENNNEREARVMRRLEGVVRRLQALERVVSSHAEAMNRMAELVDMFASCTGANATRSGAASRLRHDERLSVIERMRASLRLLERSMQGETMLLEIIAAIMTTTTVTTAADYFESFGEADRRLLRTPP